MAFHSDDISINTLIGQGSFVQGELKVNGFIRIDGDINGNLETDGRVIISEKARFNGNLKAKSVIIGGIILGDVTAKDGVQLLPSSALIGNIITKKVQIDEEAIFNGHCISLKDENQYATELDKFLQEKAIQEKASIL